jgi:gamma-glutamyltranspeptidase/glutathione hydrolase
MRLDYSNYPYPARRTVVFGGKGMVATSQPLAAQAGLDILKKGGNAIDAAVATAACLTVVEPTSNGIGADAFAIIWTKGKLHGLNSSGCAPKAISIEALTKEGHKEMPTHGWIPVTVPGAPGAWAELVEKFGRLPLTEVLKPAIEYAQNGYPVSPVVSEGWRSAFNRYSKILQGDQFKAWFDTFAIDGKTPRAGEIWRSADHARTLQLIAETKAEAFYKGELADKIDSFSRQYDGYLRKEDLETFKPQWVDPIKADYRGYEVWELPPNGHGMVTLMALNILKGFEFGTPHCVETYHKQIEAIKLAYVDGLKYITDPSKMQVSVKDLLSEAYAEERRRLIGDTAMLPLPGDPPKGGTVYLAAADGEGNMISYIQSNYMGFGSGLVVPGTGIALQNRGHSFSLDPMHHNALEPGKKTYHTIIPGFLTKNGLPIGPFGVMGGFMQPQGHLQVAMNTIDFKMNPQAALDAPRWRWIKEKAVEVERHFPFHIAEQLQRKGHLVNTTLAFGEFGRGQIIWRNENGVLAGGTESRADGAVAAY